MPTEQTTAFLYFGDPLGAAWASVLSMLCRDFVAIEQDPTDSKGAMQTLMASSVPRRVTLFRPISLHAAQHNLTYLYLQLAADACRWSVVTMPRNLLALKEALATLVVNHTQGIAEESTDPIDDPIDFLALGYPTQNPTRVKRLAGPAKREFARFLWDLLTPASEAGDTRSLTELIDRHRELAVLACSDDHVWTSALLAYAHTAVKIYRRLLDAPDGGFWRIADVERERLAGISETIAEEPTDQQLQPFHQRILAINGGLSAEPGGRVTGAELKRLQLDIHLVSQVLMSFESLTRT